MRFDWRQGSRGADRQRHDRDRRWGQRGAIRRRLLGAGLGLALLVLPVWAQDAPQEALDAGLKARGQAFWAARIREDFAAQYSLLEPKVRRQMSLTNYIQGQGPLQYLEAHIEAVQIDEAKGILTVRTLVQVRHPLLERRPHQTTLREEWVKRQGEWYRLHPQS